MKVSKIILTMLVVLGFSTIVFSQKSNIFYPQFTGKNGSFSMNYDRKIGSTQKENVYFSLHGHVGIGKLSSQEVIATKFIKGSSSYVHYNDILLDFFFNLAATKTPDVTLVRQQFFDVTNYNLGSKILLGNGKFNGIIGLDVRFDRINQRIEAWENLPQQTRNFNNTALSPSVGLRWNKDNLMAQIVLAPQTIYGRQNSTDGRLNIGFGFQF